MRHVRHREHVRAARSIAGIRPAVVIADIDGVVGRQPRPRPDVDRLLLHASARRSGCSPSWRASPTTPVCVHGMLLPMIDVYRDAGVAHAADAGADRRPRGTSFAGELVLAPPSARGTPWMRRLGDLSDALRLRPDARARRPPPARLRSRLRPVRSRRLAGAARDHRARPAPRRVLATHGHAEPLARFLREQGVDGGVIRTAWEDEEPARTTPNEALRRGLFAAIDRHRRRPTPRSRRWCRYFADGAARRRGVGGVLPDRPAAEAAGAWRSRSATGRWPRPASSEWLLGECYAVVGDGAETATLHPRSAAVDCRRRSCSLAEWVEGRILPLRQAPPERSSRR